MLESSYVIRQKYPLTKAKKCMVTNSVRFGCGKLFFMEVAEVYAAE